MNKPPHRRNRPAHVRQKRHGRAPDREIKSTPPQLAEHILRPYLIHSYAVLAKEYPVLATMPAEEAVNHLLRLHKAKQVQINLTSTPDDRIKCQIIGKI